MFRRQKSPKALQVAKNADTHSLYAYLISSKISLAKATMTILVWKLESGALHSIVTFWSHVPPSATHLRKEFRSEQWLKKAVDPSMQYVYEVEVGSCRNKRAAERETWLWSRSWIISCITSPPPRSCSLFFAPGFLLFPLLSIILDQPLLKLPGQVMDETQVSPSALIMHHAVLQWLFLFQ